MRHGKQIVTVSYVELLRSEREEVELEYDLTVTVWPPEPKVMYDRNGDGYPGSPPDVEVTEAVCTSVNRRGCDYVPGKFMAAALGRGLLRRREMEREVYDQACEQAAEACQPGEWP